MALSSMKWLGAIAIGATMMASCTSSAHIEKDASADFSKYKTYSWAPEENTKTKKANRRQQLTDQNIKNSVDDQLEKNGFRKVNNDPDVLVSTDLLVEKNQQVNNNPIYSQGYSRSFYNPYTRRISTMYYPSQFLGYDSYETTVKEGTLTVTIIDTDTDKPVFQGWTTDQLNSNMITGKEIDQQVRSIFKKYDKK